jgi:hypothetical protein
MKSYGIFIRTLIVGSLTWVGLAWSSTFRPLPLSRLAQESTLVVVATPVSAKSHWATVGSTSRVVTDVVIEVGWTLRGDDSTGRQLVVRTLGGEVGNIGYLVHGEARLAIGQTCLAFLVSGHDGELHVLGMAQGHYPLEPISDGDWQITPSPALDGVMQPDLSAAYALSGRRVSELPVLLRPHEVLQ